MLCKLTLLILYPLLPMLWLVYRLRERRTMIGRDWRGQGEMLAAAMFVSMYVINCGYLFEGTFTPLGNFRFQTTLFAGCRFLGRRSAGRGEPVCRYVARHAARANSGEHAARNRCAAI